MTDKQALREKFEAWAEEAGALPWGHIKKQRTASGNYSVQIYTYMWQAWNACHEALLDELEAKDRRIAKLSTDRARGVETLQIELIRARIRAEAAEKRIADQQGIILSARQFISEYAASGDAGADEFVKVIDRAAGIQSIEGEG
ncbi:TPA: hypothetical protein U2L56_000941 [Citrobacter koseri]|nr:hypothetical protein [Citrobacter koseri]HEM7934054.1 hypothetical protein [Citrobacter koseri]